MIKAAQLFPSAGHNLDLSAGKLDSADIYNNLVAANFNRVIEGFSEDEEDPFVENANASVKSSDERSPSGFGKALNPEEPSIFGSKEFLRSPEGPTVSDMFSENRYESEESPSGGMSSKDLAPRELGFFKPVSNGVFSVVDSTRDTIKNFRSVPGKRFVSLDFNDADNKSARGIEIKIPKNASKDEVRASQEWALRLQKFYASKGLKVPIRRGDGVKRDGRGVSGVFHAEPFFKSNEAARRAIESDPDGFAEVYASTLGTLPGVTFIPPHEQGGRAGAVIKGPKGSINERDFARKHIIPSLIKLASKK